jgi:hypothetical protein
MTTTIGYVILAHQDPHLVARLARLLLANDGVVAIHYDLSTNPDDFATLRASLEDDADRIVWPKRVRVAWGEWSIVQATLNALEAIAASGASLDFVHLMSGTDYPIRPLAEFRDYLERHKGTEYIECADMMSENWVKGGLTHERYQYRHYFNWKSHTAFFDRSWVLQRALGLKRSFPKGLRPHLGSQWFTLSWSSARAVLAAGRDRRLTSFFRTVWIPDEMFIQSVIGSAEVARPKGPILTLYQFTETGVPVVYCNDHAEYLARQPFFFARKISPHANRLRDALDDYVSGARPVTRFPDKAFGVRTKEYQRHLEKWGAPRAGVRLLGYEKDHWRGDLVYQEAPILAVYGASHAELRAVAALLNRTGRYFCHGALFHPDRIEFAGDAASYAGYAKDDLALRDDRRRNFLRDVAQEASEDVVVGFLAPWTMDEHVRDRMIWSGFSRNVIVRGNMMRAFHEYLERRAAADEAEIAADCERTFAPEAGENGTSAGKTAVVSPEEFHEFEKEYTSYYADVWTGFNDAGAKFTEIDLLSDGWARALIEFLQTDDVAPPKLARAYAKTFTNKALCKEVVPVDPAGRHIANARELLDYIPDHNRRIAHLKDFARGGMYGLERPILAIFGASHEELRAVAALLNRTGRFLCHGALFHPDHIEFAGDAARYAGYAKNDLALRNDEGRNFLGDVARQAGDDVVVGFLAPWTMDERVRDRMAWFPSSRNLIVRGNMMRAFQEYLERRAAADKEEAVGTFALEPAEDRTGTEKTTVVSPEEFHEFEKEYTSYYADVWREFNDAGAKFAEIDLLADGWGRALIEFLQTDDVAPPKLTRAYATMFTKKALCEELAPIAPSGRLIANAREFIDYIPDDHRRVAHLKDFARERLSQGERPVVAILGASREEINFIAKILEHAGHVLSCDRRAPEQADLARDDFFYEGLGKKPSISQERDELSNQNSTEDENHELVVLVPWTAAADEAGELAIWNASSRVIIVRGNIIRALLEYRAQFADDSRGSSESSSDAGEFISMKEFQEFIERHAKYYDEKLEACRATEVDFSEIDLMNGDWIRELINFIEVGDLQEDGLRVRVLQQAEFLSNPFPKVRNSFRLISLISEENRRNAHLVALKGARRRSAAIASESPARGDRVLLAADFEA